MAAWITVVLVAVLSYLAGSVPFSILVGKLLYGKDPRDHGSGNAGATNAFRVLGWRAGVVVIAGDVGKGVLATLLVARIGSPEILGGEAYALIAGASAVLGHVFSVFAGFRGGKGVGTAAGMLAVLYPAPFSIALAAFAFAIMISGYVSAGSLTAAVVFPATIWIAHAAGIADFSPLLRGVCIGAGALIVFTHRRNIVRLARGTENRFEKLMVLARRRPGSRDRSAQRNGTKDTTE